MTSKHVLQLTLFSAPLIGALAFLPACAPIVEPAMNLVDQWGSRSNTIEARYVLGTEVFFRGDLPASSVTLESSDPTIFELDGLVGRAVGLGEAELLFNVGTEHERRYPIHVGRPSRVSVNVGGYDSPVDLAFYQREGLTVHVMYFDELGRLYGDHVLELPPELPVAIAEGSLMGNTLRLAPASPARFMLPLRIGDVEVGQLRFRAIEEVARFELEEDSWGGWIGRGFSEEGWPVVGIFGATSLPVRWFVDGADLGTSPAAVTIQPGPEVVLRAELDGHVQERSVRALVELPELLED